MTFTPKMLTDLAYFFTNTDRSALEQAGTINPGKSGDDKWKRYNHNFDIFILKSDDKQLTALAKLVNRYVSATPPPPQSHAQSAIPPVFTAECLGGLDGGGPVGKRTEQLHLASEVDDRGPGNHIVENSHIEFVGAAAHDALLSGEDRSDANHGVTKKPVSLNRAGSVVQAPWDGFVPPQMNVACPCTLIEQDEDCPVGYPSMICGICKGTGNTTQDQVTALACEMIKIASDVGEPEDPFAAWESIDLIKSQNGQLRKALEPFAKFRTPGQVGTYEDRIREHFSPEKFAAARAALAASATEDGR